jgi:hypothetical protein
VEIRGSPNEICRQFGIGYRISVDSLKEESQVTEIRKAIVDILNSTDESKIQFEDMNFLA